MAYTMPLALPPHRDAMPLNVGEMYTNDWHTVRLVSLNEVTGACTVDNGRWRDVMRVSAFRERYRQAPKP